MTMGASEFYEAGLALPPSVRKDVALRLLESIEVADQESVDEAWTEEIESRVDDIISGKVKTVPHEEVLAHLAERRAARKAARQQA
ncbi:MAG TPA: addiction module protein [Marmoricola sp.]|nr:addiction module protein [Marmoricola sp.]